MAVQDVLARIEPVARDLMARVDAALLVHGAPAGHPVWAQLRRLGSTPADAVAYFADADPAPLRAAGDAVRQQARGYAGAPVPAKVRWEGAVGELYATQARALHGYLGEQAAPDAESLTGRLDATASYVDDVAEWWSHSRGLVAVALAEVLTCAQAVTLGAAPIVGDELTRLGERLSAPAVVAAADIGTHVLAAAARAHEAGHDLIHRWAGRLDELPFHPATPGGPTRFDATIHVRH